MVISLKMKKGAGIREMNIKYGNNLSQGKAWTYLELFNPFQRQEEHERYLRRRFSSDNDPEKPPKPEPGDKGILIFLIIGLIVGGVLGAISGGLLFGVAGVLLGLFSGLIAGGIIGAIIGDKIKKRRENPEDNARNRPDLPG